eukprot:COSAG06_NODE_23565_length_688_cov_0.857385_1_plen_20_part_10
MVVACRLRALLWKQWMGSVP